MCEGRCGKSTNVLCNNLKVTLSSKAPRGPKPSNRPHTIREPLYPLTCPHVCLRSGQVSPLVFPPVSPLNSGEKIPVSTPVTTVSVVSCLK